MRVVDYELIANSIAGPDAREAVRAIAEALHANESLHMHEGTSSPEPCSYCWLRSGQALRAMRRFAGHPHFASLEGAEGPQGSSGEGE